MKIQESRKYFILFYMAGFLTGIFGANLLFGEYMEDMGIFHEFFLEQYVQTPIDTREYFWYLCQIRVTPLIFLGILGCTRFRKAAVALFLAWTGFLSGMILTEAVIQMGAQGIILCLVGLLPQFLFYVSGYLILLWFLFGYPKRQWNVTKTVFFLFLITTGMILECSVNPVLMKLFLKTI